ncbi:ultraviolet-B receptor UVR8 [Impatiens glandulifera]|uniref:ultraviolet-B receptor UVR8 n=1 Tax=Impatiens glandulifera TaxID=253017 RepID=UPI001FB10AE7|nr:ultraviolet-B receptor UVR8 [Impatiens glandulifera]
MLRLFKNGKATGDNLITRIKLRTRGKHTAVLSFGDGSQGALGLPISVVGMSGDAYEPTPVPGLPLDVSSISAGHYHSLAVTSHGEIWAWGRNNEAQLGRGLHASRETWNEAKRVEGMKVSAKAAFASGVVSASIGEDGSLWVWGKSKRGQLGLGRGITEAISPSHVKSLSGEEIVKVSFGWGHALALTKDGKLFGWGYSADGRLGQLGGTVEASFLESSVSMSKTANKISCSTSEAAEIFLLEAIEKEKDMPIIWEPCLIKELEDVNVVDIACGHDHSLVLCSNGTLLSGGSNVYGQLGRTNQELDLLRVDTGLHTISLVASGLGHSLAICPSKNILSWGWNQNSQLGRKGPENMPLLVQGCLEQEIVNSLSGGRAHSIAITSKGEIWSWGSGRNGRLGLGSSIDEKEPMLIECLEGSEVLQAVCGLDHSLALVSY